MAKVGNTLVELLSQLDEDGDKGVPNSNVKFKIKSPDFRRFLGKLGTKVDDMKSSLEYLAEQVEKTFFNHFMNDEGPNTSETGLEAWAPNVGGSNSQYLKWKEKHGAGNTMLHLTGALEESLHKDGPDNIHNVTNRTLEVGTNIGYYIFAHTGFTGRNGEPLPEQTKRTIVGLTDEEEADIIEDFKEFFFGDLDD